MSRKVLGECAVDDCHTEGRLRRGWCIKHYQRWVRYGDTERHPRQYAPVLDRMFELVDVGDCWLWTGRLSPGGYAVFSVVRGTHRAHRIVWEELVGPLPKGLTLDHLCRVRHCVNPDHLEVVDIRTNTLRSPISPAAINSRKTHCKYGHPFSGDNLRITPEGYRACMECKRRASREWQRAKA